ncbi:MAG: outer membrane protein assembly factor BamB, partial [Planctomycetota bacterium]
MMPRSILSGATVLLTTLMTALVLTTASCTAQTPGQSPTQAGGWLSWRGPDQNGTSTETGLPTSLAIGGDTKSWRYELKGRGTPVIANGRVYTLGYRGTGKSLDELLVCLNETDGSLIWEKRFPHFLTDIIYHRFALGSPTIDAKSGNIFCMTSAGVLCSFTPSG